MHIGWAQGLWFGITLFGLGVSAAKHNQPAPKYNFFISLTTNLLVFGLLWWGGFFR